MQAACPPMYPWDRAEAAEGNWTEALPLGLRPLQGQEEAVQCGWTCPTGGRAGGGMEDVGQSASPTSGKLQGRGAQTGPQRPRQALGMEDLRTPTNSRGEDPGQRNSLGDPQRALAKKNTFAVSFF